MTPDSIRPHPKRKEAPDGRPAHMHSSAANGMSRTLVTLIKKLDASVDARNSKEWTALDCAADAGHIDCCKVLIDNDAEVDSRDKNLITPLHLGCRRGHIEIVRLLLRNGADLGARARDGNNAIDFAIDSYHEDCVREILRSDDWRRAMMNAIIITDKTTKKVSEILTPMRKLIRNMPEEAFFVLNRCTTIGKEEDQIEDVTSASLRQKNLMINFDFTFMDDDYEITRWIQV